MRGRPLADTTDSTAAAAGSEPAIPGTAAGAADGAASQAEEGAPPAEGPSAG
jgi:hypothetical protein